LFSGISFSYADDTSPLENTNINLVLSNGEIIAAENGFYADFSTVKDLTLDYDFISTDSGILMSIAGWVGSQFQWTGYKNAKEKIETNLTDISGIRLMLTGDLALKYDIYYSVKIATLTGWLDWAKNNEATGFDSFAGKKITNIKIRLLEKGTKTLNKGGLIYGYKKSFNRTGYIISKYNFYDEPYESGVKKLDTSNSLKNTNKKKIKVTIKEKSRTNNKNTYLLVHYKNKKKGWINIDAFDQGVTRKHSFKIKIKSYKKYYLYTITNEEPSELQKGKLYGKGKTLSAKYKYRNNFNQTFFVLESGEVVNSKNFITQHSSLKKGKAKVEKAIKAGSKLIKKSKYLWGGGRSSYSVKKKRFDCSSFVHYAYSKARKKLGSRSSATTVTLKYYGKKVKYKNLKRGDLVFFDYGGGARHVAIYLGNQFFIHDSPSSDSGGVDIDSLNDPVWKSGLCGKYRRVV
jgi:cell wall-associated NlpC family hydrolase